MIGNKKGLPRWQAFVFETRRDDQALRLANIATASIGHCCAHCASGSRVKPDLA